mgnify:CR=1 FL=1
MSSKRDYYEILGTSREASADEIKRIYRKLARQYHPDVNRHDESAEERFKEINEAYEVLSDPQKRAVYDQYGHQGLDGRYSGSGGFEGFGDFGGFGDIFDAFFGSGARTRGHSSAQEGSDIRVDVELTLEEVSAGADKTVRVSRMGQCDVCDGTGAQPGSGVETCSTCSGTGQVRHSQQTILGSFQTIVTCPTCHGEGRTIKDPCTACGGHGRLRQTEEREIRIPAGVESGSRIRIRGAGDTGLRGGPPGDLYVFVQVSPHEVFERQGDDIYLEMPISFVQAALGDTVEVPTLHGDEKLHIPEGTQTGASFKLVNKGIPNLTTGVRGNQYVIVRVTTPRKLNDEQKQILQQFAESCGMELNPEGKNFFERLLGK